MNELSDAWRIIDAARFSPSAESVPLAASLGRVLATDVSASIDVPPFDQSAVDGYAFPSAPQGATRVLGTVAAGDRSPATGCVRILTGACVPAETFAIAKQEDCVANNGYVTAGVSLARGENIRRRGGVIRCGEHIASAETTVTPGLIGLLAGAGVGELAVASRPEILHVVCGEELRPPGAPIETGQIPDANGPMISALLAGRGLSVRTICLGDDLEMLCGLLAGSSEDLVLVSGGSGGSERDHTAEALGSAGFSLQIRGVRSRPGKPLLFATNGNRGAFGLPGNPLSHWVCFHAFVTRWLGEKPTVVDAVCSGELRAGFWTPGTLSADESGWHFTPRPFVHSGDLTPLATANAMAFPESASGGSSRVLVCGRTMPQ